jgi:hypothetical protein
MIWQEVAKSVWCADREIFGGLLMLRAELYKGRTWVHWDLQINEAGDDDSQMPYAFHSTIADGKERTFAAATDAVKRAIESNWTAAVTEWADSLASDNIGLPVTFNMKKG